MKKYLLLVFCLAAAAVAKNVDAQSYSAPINGNRQERAQRPPTPVYREKAVGAFVRGAHGGNPLQLINPRAPRKYRGSPEDTVVADTPSSSSPQRNRGESPNRYAAVVLLGISW
ncbi:MAG: hypothetical protein ACR2HH_00490 [Chthoniobacterales bacterium]